MDRINEALGKILPAEQINEVRQAVEAMLAEQVKELEAEYQKKLEEAYEQIAGEKENSEAVAEQGYQQAYEIITSLMQRLDEQREEFEQALEEGFEEAYQELQKEKGKNDNVEVELYDEFDNKLKEMKTFMVDKVDQFLSLQENELYECAKRDVLNDPRLAEQRVVVTKMVDVLSDYIDRDDLAGVTSAKLEETHKAVEEMKGQMRILEAKNVRLSTQNNKLNEQVRQAQELITESNKNEKKERASKVKNASGRGQRVVNEQVVPEYNAPAAKSEESNGDLREAHDPLGDLLVLSGISEG